MNALTNAQANIDVTSVSPSQNVSKPAAAAGAQADINKLDLSKELKPSQVSREDVENMVEALKDLTETLQTKLNFSVDEGTNDIVVKVIDRDTEQVIRQIPPESMLELQEKMQDLTGFLLSDNI